MIRYHCDFTNEVISPEQMARCHELRLEFCREAGLNPQGNPVASEIFIARIEPVIKDYWREKAEVLKELREQAEARIANHRKEFAKSRNLFDKQRLKVAR